MKRILKWVGLILLFLLIGIFLFVGFSFYNSLPKIKGQIAFKALSSEVKVVRDKWGVPHIFAQNEKDLIFAAGFVQAQDRMWQMEMTRRAGQGRLSEIFGPKTLERDKYLRNLGLKEAAEKDYEKLSPQLKDLLLSYCQGVNTWMETRSFNWPPEFFILRHRPVPWTIMDSIIIKEMMAMMLSTDYSSEMVRAKLTKILSPQRALELLEEGVEIPSGLSEESFLSGAAGDIFFSGASNSWVLAGSRTQSGKPLLANDPHLEISLPPIWYEIHLFCPTLNVTGVSLPGVPLVIIGHNDSIAWGMTNSMADVQDLYIEKFNSSGDMYLDGENWKPLVKKEEIIKIKRKSQPERIEILWTEQGPIVSPRVVDNKEPISLCWTIYDGGKIFESIYLLNRARNWQEFQEAVSNFDAPSQNFVYADVEGNIGYYLSGKIPMREKQAALFPFPGWKSEGKWQGYLEEEKKPNLFNPSEGFIVTANDKIHPDDYPYYISVVWDLPFRIERIKELLLKQEKHSVKSFERIQNDIYSKQAELIIPYLKEVKGAEGKTNEALALIRNWDGNMDSGAAPAIFRVFMRFFHEEIFKDELDKEYRFYRGRLSGLLRILSDPTSPWFDNKNTPVVETRDEIIKSSLAKAYEWLEKKYGSAQNWDWTKMHSIKFRHSLGRILFLSFLNKGKYPLDGDSFTIRASFGGEEFHSNYGASFRQIIDLSNFRNSICIITSGQSGHFLSHHYGDQIPLWLRAEYHPMLFDRKDIEANAEGILILKPQAK